MKPERRIIMIVPGSQMVDMADGMKLTDDESFRANQFMLTKGYRATQLFMKLAESSNNKFALKVLNEVVDENNVHVNESLKLLHDLADEEEKVLFCKTREVEEMLTASDSGF